MATEMEERLNTLWREGDTSKYINHVSTIKALGAKVYRNSDGLHKIKYNLDDTMKAMDKLNEDRKRRNMEAFMNGLLGK